MLEIMKEYGKVVAKLTAIQKDMEVLQEQKTELQDQKRKLEDVVCKQQMEIEMTEQRLVEVVSWANELRNTFLDYCAKNNVQMTLPPQPLAITNNNFYNGSQNVERLDSQKNIYNQ